MAVGTGVDRWTGRPISGWPHVVRCLEAIFTTLFGSRVMRRWVGSFIPRLLGENLTPDTLVRFFTAIYAALEFEPRFALTKINILSSSDDLRLGGVVIELEGQYRPRAHLGDFTVEGGRKVTLAVARDGSSIRELIA